MLMKCPVKKVDDNYNFLLAYTLDNFIFIADVVAFKQRGIQPEA